MNAEKKYTKKTGLFGFLKKSSENTYSNTPSAKATKSSARPNIKFKIGDDKSANESFEIKEISANPNSILHANTATESEFSITKRAEEAQNTASGLDLNLPTSEENLSNLQIKKDSKLFQRNSVAKDDNKIEEVKENSSISEVGNNTYPSEFSNEKFDEALKAFTENQEETFLLLENEDNSKKKNRLVDSDKKSEVRVGTLSEITAENKAPKEKWSWKISLSATSLAMTFGGLLLVFGFFFSFGFFIGKGLTPEAATVPLASIVPDNENVVIDSNAQTLKPEELEYAKVLKTVPVKEELVDPDTVFLGADGKILPAGTYIVAPDGSLHPENTVILDAEGKPIPQNTIVLGEEGKAIEQNIVTTSAQTPYPIGKMEVVTPVEEAEPVNVIEPVIEEPKIYDFVLRAASFKDEKLADNLRQALEGDGLRTQLVKSGSWYMVNIRYRGTEENFNQIRSSLRKHRITDAVTVSKEEVIQES